uniref:Endonuclease domain-containing 1 protein-like n=1 Tax=Serinus canaria TaxID=9135 RepID=A0A8C9MZ03_SERCA
MLGLLLLQVLASCLWLGHRTPPNDALNPKNPAWICQHFSNSYHYATLYDKDRRIPVYSAYKYQPGNAKTPDAPWFVEPQLIGKNNLKEMERQSVLIEQHKFTLDQIKASQAVYDDYAQLKGLNHGHLSPCDHQDSKENKTATFTFTNIVPLDSSLNKGQWHTYESKTMPKMTEGCTTTYVITGAVPGKLHVSQGRVNRPSHIWSAACCLVGQKTPKAWGAIAENDKNKVENLSLGELENRLTKLYGGKKKVTLFNKACPRQ